MSGRFPEAAKRIGEKLWRNKFLVLAVLIGAILLSLPSANAKTAAGDGARAESGETFSVADEEKRLAAILSQVDGAGRVSVMLSVRGGTERIVAVDEEASEREGERETSKKTVTVSSGSSAEAPVVLRYAYPEYLGAVVVAEGAGGGAVRLGLTRAVSSLTGLGSDKITVIKMR